MIQYSQNRTEKIVKNITIRIADRFFKNNLSVNGYAYSTESIITMKGFFVTERVTIGFCEWLYIQRMKLKNSLNI